MQRLLLLALISSSPIGCHPWARSFTPIWDSPAVVLDYQCLEPEPAVFGGNNYCMFVPCVCDDGVPKRIDAIDLYLCHDGDVQSIQVGASPRIEWPDMGTLLPAHPEPSWSGPDCGWVRFNVEHGQAFPPTCSAPTSGTIYIAIQFGAAGPDVLFMGANAETESGCPTPIYQWDGEDMLNTGLIGGVRVWLKSPAGLE